MSEIKWTDAQQAAIDARGDVLVSAAAGSGKTAVLVERVMRMIETECDIDALLIVTFTRSAAAQMKEKIAQAIEKKLAADPYSKRFQRQQILLEKAQITTIDAFCADVLKNNFQLLGDMNIAMNYKNLDAAEFSVLSTEVLDAVLDEFYESGDAQFGALMDVFTSGKNDLNIYTIINTLHNYTSAFVDKAAWMHEKTGLYEARAVADSPWGNLLLSAIRENLLLAHDYIAHALSIVAEDAPTDAVYGALFREDMAVTKHALEAAKAKDWATLYAYKDFKFPRYSAVKKGIDAELRALAKPYRDAARKAFEAATAYLIEIESDFARDNAFLHPIAEQLQKLFERYESKLFEAKLERQSFEFSDIAYLALRILVDENGEPTEAAREYQQKYYGICIDEYQDTNGVQDMIFKTIENHNLFVVGDVKQSIYRFRQAMPEIFIGRRKALAPYESGADSGYILLKNNFRSEKPITDFVNFLFKKIMSEAVGDVEYSEDEYLIPGIHGDDTDAAPCELHILNSVQAEGAEKIKKSYYESRYIAQLIKHEIAAGKTIGSGESEKPLSYSDYCVLVRSKTHLKELEQAFEEEGVPCRLVAGENLFETAEITLIMSFLRAIDNPLRDVDLLSVMYSEIFGFTAEELALIRIGQREGSLYAAVRTLAEAGNRKCAALIEQIEHYRTLAATNEPAEFLRKLYRESALPEILCAEENGETKKANLFKFISVAQLYSAGGYYGLTGLVRFLEKVKANNPDMASAVVPESDSKVNIMTVHASKGLEFPVVIFAFTNQNNNHYGTNIVLNREYGIGMKPKYPEENARYETIAYSAVSLANLRSDMAEEIRTLYVALTRPKNRLIITGTYEGKEGSDKRAEALGKIALLSATSEGKIREGWLRANNNYLSWLIACAFMHEKAGNLRAQAGVEHMHIDTAFSGKLQIFLPDYTPEQVGEEIQIHTAKSDEQMKQRILSNFHYVYEFAGAEHIDSKKTPSAVAEQGGADLEYSFDPPAFMRAEVLNAAGRGTATHRFMEKVSSFTDFDYETELRTMLQKGFLSETQAQVLDKKSICTFFESPLAKRMASAEHFVREYEIAYLEDAGFFDESLPPVLQHEKVFVDGMIDAAFTENGKVHIVDYKTDRVKSGEELVARYVKQMQLYKRALESVWGMPVVQCHLYSFHLNEDIVIDF